jgi:hypothetical protein
MAATAPIPLLENAWAATGPQHVDYFLSEPDTTNVYTVTATNSGTAAVGDTHGGGLVLSPSDGDAGDNDEIYFQFKNEIYKPQVNKPFRMRALVNWTEAATNAANVFVGAANAPIADFIVDDGGGIRTSGTIFGVYKIDGSNLWRAISRVDSAVQDDVSNVATPSGSDADIEVRIHSNGTLPTLLTATYYVNGEILTDSLGRPIIHKTTLTNATEITPVVGVKNGTAAQQALTVKLLSFGLIV